MNVSEQASRVVVVVFVFHPLLLYGAPKELTHVQFPIGPLRHGTPHFRKSRIENILSSNTTVFLVVVPIHHRLMHITQRRLSMQNIFRHDATLQLGLQVGGACDGMQGVTFAGHERGVTTGQVIQDGRTLERRQSSGRSFEIDHGVNALLRSLLHGVIDRHVQTAHGICVKGILQRKFIVNVFVFGNGRERGTAAATAAAGGGAVVAATSNAATDHFGCQCHD